MNKRSPKFGFLYSGIWPYEEFMGVGMLFEGIPNDKDKDKFIEWMMDYSCHPKAGERIYNRLCTIGYDKLTVMFSLPFDEIAIGLRIFGVKLSIIPPLEGWKHLYEDGDYPEDFIPTHLRGINKR